MLNVAAELAGVFVQKVGIQSAYDTFFAWNPLLNLEVSDLPPKGS